MKRLAKQKVGGDQAKNIYNAVRPTSVNRCGKKTTQPNELQKICI